MNLPNAVICDGALQPLYIRFWHFERLHHIERPDLNQKLLDHVIEQYINCSGKADQYALFTPELVKRVAEGLPNGWQLAFCHT